MKFCLTLLTLLSFASPLRAQTAETPDQRLVRAIEYVRAQTNPGVPGRFALYALSGVGAVALARAAETEGERMLTAAGSSLFITGVLVFEVMRATMAPRYEIQVDQRVLKLLRSPVERQLQVARADANIADFYLNVAESLLRYEDAPIRPRVVVMGPQPPPAPKPDRSSRSRD